jgi:hypothetical protein
MSYRPLITAALSPLLLGAMCCLAGCGDKKPDLTPADGPMERTGEAIDKAAEKTGEVIEKGVDKTGEKLEEAGEKLQE